METKVASSKLDGMETQISKTRRANLIQWIVK